MDYHSDRFQDFSLLVFVKEELTALLPANIVDDVLHSHLGLTYGGLILKKKTSLNEVNSIFDCICGFLKSKKINTLHIKQIPIIYHNLPTQELNFFLDKKGDLVKRQMVLAIDYSKPLQIHKTKLKHYKKSDKLGLIIKEENDFSAFWNDVLIPRLKTKHKVKPVHTYNEITQLNNDFPDQIKQFNIYLEDKLLAGITLFETGITVKSQYGATTKSGEKVRALDYLFLFLINKYKAQGKQFFSMGTVADDSEIGYNKGLLKQKEELGCSLYMQDFYKVDIKNYRLVDKLIT